VFQGRDLHVYSDREILHAIECMAVCAGFPCSNISHIPALIFTSLMSEHIVVMMMGDGIMDRVQEHQAGKQEGYELLQLHCERQKYKILSNIKFDKYRMVGGYCRDQERLLDLQLKCITMQEK
jgi:hypothetical protein